MLSFLILPPLLSIMAISSTISVQTRSPPSSMPSYVKLPLFRFASSRWSCSGGYWARRDLATLIMCLGFPQSYGEDH